MYQQEFRYRPVFKVWLSTNHPPKIRGTDHAIWRRIKRVDFNVSFLGRADKELGEKLQAEASGILNWMLEGLREYRRVGGLLEPASVTEANRQYRKQESPLAEFIEQCCDLQPDVRETCQGLWERYDRWANRPGHIKLNRDKFGKALNSIGIERDPGKRYRLGIKLKIAETFDV